MRHFDKNEGQMEGNSQKWNAARSSCEIAIIFNSFVLSVVRITLPCYLLDIVEEDL